MKLKTGSKVKYMPKTKLIRATITMELAGRIGTAMEFDLERGYTMVDFEDIIFLVYWDEMEVVEA